MKVFISWSGSRSRNFAEKLRAWLPKVLQASQPWMSDEDINSGTRWAGEIAKELSDCNFGIICVTPENKHNPWLLFEAGALSKALPGSFVCPLLLNFSPSELDGPLAQFQANPSNKEGIRKVLFAINKTLKNQLEESDLIEIFDVWWPKLEAEISAIQPPSPTAISKRSVDDVLSELVELSREQLRRENIRIAHQKERDKKLDQLNAVFEKMTSEAHQFWEASKSPLKSLAGLEGFPSVGREISSADFEQIKSTALKLAQEFTQQPQAPNPLESLAEFRTITNSIDQQDKNFYSAILESEKKNDATGDLPKP